MTVFEIDAPKFYRIETNIVVSSKSKNVLWQTTHYIDGKVVTEDMFKEELAKEKAVKNPTERIRNEHNLRQ